MIEDTRLTTNNTSNKTNRGKTLNVARAVLIFIKSHINDIDPELYKRTEKGVYDLIDEYVEGANENKYLALINKLEAYVSLIKDRGADIEDKCLLLIKGLRYIKDTNAHTVTADDLGRHMSLETEDTNIKDTRSVLSVSKSVKDMSSGYAPSVNQVVSHTKAVNHTRSVPSDTSYSKLALSQSSSTQTSSTPKAFINMSGSISESRRDESMRKLGRKSEVLSLLTGTPMSIKEISSRIIGCSEKTVQRELNNLLSEGLILRAGEKRWSKYYVASSNN